MKIYSTIVIGMFSLLIISCGGKESSTGTTESSAKPIPPGVIKEELIANLKKSEAKLYGSKKFDEVAASSMINEYVNYARTFPDDSLSADYLFKAGEISSSLRQGAQSISFFKEAYEKYPSYNKANYCLFLQAFVYETQLKDLTKAKDIYLQVIKKYPGQQVAKDAQASINNLGKSDEELIKEFEAKNKKN